MDVLSYTAFNQQVEYQRQIREKENCYRTLVNEKVAQIGGGGGGSSVSALKWLCEIEPCLLWNPVQWTTANTISAPKFWDCIPTGEGWTNGILVCDDTGYYRCGRSCTWCVPGGVTCARFQLWGSGGGSGSSRSYSDSPHGSSGAYVSAIVKVTPGQCFCMCGGCAYCCYSTAGGHGRVPGCPSWVSDQHGVFCNFCAEGGDGTLLSWTGNTGKCSSYRTGTACCPESGSCICEQGMHACNGQVCAICQGPLEFIAGSMYNGCIKCDYWAGSTDEEKRNNAIVYGIRGIWPRWCHDSSKYGWSVTPPVYGYETCAQCCITWSSGNCCAYPYCSAWQSSCLRIPATGGWETHSWGNDGICADAGRFGQVCVSWKCS